MFGNTKFFYSFAAAIKRKTMEVKIIQMEVSEFKATVKGLMMEALTEYQLAAQQDAPAIDDLIGTAEACEILGWTGNALLLLCAAHTKRCTTVVKSWRFVRPTQGRIETTLNNTSTNRPRLARSAWPLNT